MTKPTKVQAPEGCASRLTAGKIYDVVGFWQHHSDDDSGHRFNIISDNGNKISCLERDCAYLNGGNWIIIETE